MHKAKNKSNEWKVKVDRPEELLGTPDKFYTDEEVEKYSKLGSMKKTQQKIAQRIIELLEIQPPAKLLDLGSGVGYTAEVYKETGFDVTALDVLPNMLKKAEEKGLRTVLCDMRNIKQTFKDNEFNAVVSASALQWLKSRDDIIKVAEGIHHVLKSNGKAVIQFYPKSSDEMMEVAKTFKRSGFEVQLVLDFPENAKKRQIFLILNK